MSIEDWWRQERKAIPPRDSVPAYPWDAIGRPSPCPWSFAMAIGTDPRFMNWQRLADGIKALYRKARR